MQDEMRTEASNLPTPRNDGDPSKTSENPGVETSDWNELTAQALKRVKEFVQESLQNESAYTAALDTTSGLLFKALFQLDAALDDALRDCPDPVDRIDGVARAIDLLLRLTRQVDRLSHVRHLLGEARRALPEKGAP